MSLAEISETAYSFLSKADAAGGLVIRPIEGQVVLGVLHDATVDATSRVITGAIHPALPVVTTYEGALRAFRDLPVDTIPRAGRYTIVGDREGAVTAALLALYVRFVHKAVVSVVGVRMPPIGAVNFLDLLRISKIEVVRAGDDTPSAPKGFLHATNLVLPAPTPSSAKAKAEEEAKARAKAKAEEEAAKAKAEEEAKAKAKAEEEARAKAEAEEAAARERFVPLDSFPLEDLPALAPAPSIMHEVTQADDAELMPAPFNLEEEDAPTSAPVAAPRTFGRRKRA